MTIHARRSRTRSRVLAGLAALMCAAPSGGAPATKAVYRFLSVGAKPIQRAFGRFVFAIDADAALVEFVEPAPSAR